MHMIVSQILLQIIRYIIILQRENGARQQYYCCLQIGQIYIW